MLKKTNDIRVSAQPIRDRKYQVTAFELLHRQGDATVAQISDDALATDQVIRIVFDDGHSTGLYSWAYLHQLGCDHDPLWQDYLRRAGRA